MTVDGVRVLNAKMSLGVGIQFRKPGYSIMLPLNCPSTTSAFVGDNAFKYALDAKDATLVQERGVFNAQQYPVLGLPPCIAGGTYSVDKKHVVKKKVVRKDDVEENGVEEDDENDDEEDDEDDAEEDDEDDDEEDEVKRVQCYNATVAYNAKDGKKEEGSGVWDIKKFVENGSFRAEKMQLALSVVRVDMASLMLNIAQNGLCPRTEIAVAAKHFSAAGVANVIETALRFLIPKVRAYENKTLVDFIMPSLSTALAAMSATIKVIPKAHLLVERLALYSSLKLTCAYLQGMETGKHHRSSVMVPWVAAYEELGHLPQHIPPAMVAAELGFVAPPAPGPVFGTRSKSAQEDKPHVIKRREFYAQRLAGTCEVFVCAKCNDCFDNKDELHEHLGLDPTHNVQRHGPTQTVSVRSRVVAVLENLDTAQRAVIVSYLNGNNVHVNAKAGTGKTRVVDALMKVLKIMCGAEYVEKKVWNTAATGMAAAINGGGTVHGEFGFGGGKVETNPDQLKDKHNQSGKSVEELECLLIDESLLLPALVLEAVCRVIESTKGVENAHEAVQFFVCGDSKQLTCFDKRDGVPEVDLWCKNSAMVHSKGLCPWRVRAEKAGWVYKKLDICYRQLADPVPEFPVILELLRAGAWNHDMINTITTKLGQENPAEVITTPRGFQTTQSEELVAHPNGSLVLVMRQDRKNWFNDNQLEAQTHLEKFKIRARDGLGAADNADFTWGRDENDRHFGNHPTWLKIAVGAPVRMSRKSKGRLLDGVGEVTVPAGSMGVIVMINNPSDVSASVFIDFIEGNNRPACRVEAERVRFECSATAPREWRKGCDTRLQFPFDVAYAITFSGFQGGEAKFIVCDFAGFGDGWLDHVLYTGISRGRWGPGMKCINLPKPLRNKNVNAISPLMIEFDEYIAGKLAEEEAEKDDTRAFSFDILSRLQVGWGFKAERR